MSWFDKTNDGLFKEAALPRGYFDGLEAALETLKNQFAMAAQKVYDEWDQDEDGFDEMLGAGGICDDISRAFAEVVNEQLAPKMGFEDVELLDGGEHGDDHAYVVVINPQSNEAVAVDIPPHVYEEGGGMSWRKKPGVKFSENDISLTDVDYELITDDYEEHYASTTHAELPAQSLIKTAGVKYVRKNIEREIIRERYYRDGYIVRDELWLMKDVGFDEPNEMRAAYAPDGTYIGDPKEAYFLCHKMGIRPERASDDHSVCSIGYSPKKKKWYGWSHRAMCGFGIGDMIYEEDHGGPNVAFVDHGNRKIERIEQAREAAINFAESVS